MARAGMGRLIEQVRGMINAGTADYTLGTASYWDDDHIQTVMEQHRVDVYHEQLKSIPTYTAGGSVDYKLYQSMFQHFESGTAVFVVEDALGENIGTASYSVDYDRGIITFGSDTGGSTYFLTGRAHDLNASAADIWRQKASYFTEHYDFAAGDQRLSRSQVIKHCFVMAEIYDAKSAPAVTTLF